MKDTTPKDPPAVRVTLEQPHSHAGQSCKAGEKIDVTEAEYAWLLSRGVVAPLPLIALIKE